MSNKIDLGVRFAVVTGGPTGAVFDISDGRATY